MCFVTSQNMHRTQISNDKKHSYLLYNGKSIVFKEFLKVANDAKCTTLGGGLLQTFSIRSLKTLLLIN